MQPTAVLPSARILLAEEQAASRDLVVLVLGKLDYQIDVFGSARDALARLDSVKPALLLVSATLPDLPGPELVRAIGRRASPDPAPIVVIGPDSGEPPRSDYLLAGAFDYLARPIDIERLLRLVERSVRRRAPTKTAHPGVPPVLDLDHLRGFTDGDRQLEGELLALFLSSADVYLERMSQALRAGQPWSAFAHALKGASANLGARRVAALALDAERSTPDSAQLEAIRRAVDQVREFGQAWQT
jgi:DNA-binding response OmpR family regulator